MTPNEYQTQAARTLIDAPPRPLTSAEHMIVWTAIGLAGEAGEVLAEAPPNASNARYVAIHALAISEHVKKGILHEQGLTVPIITYNLQVMIAHVTDLCGFMNYLRADRQTLDKEVGDLLWYAAALCTKLGITMDMVMGPSDAKVLGPIMAANVEKLKRRFPAGWSTVDAAARADEVPA